MLEAIIILKLEENNGIYIYIKFFFLDFKKFIIYILIYVYIIFKFIS